MFQKVVQYSTWIATLLLFIGAVGLLVVATPLFGNKALIVRSGSMEPAISVGDVVVVRQQVSPYEVGQVISYKLPDHQNMVVTHRITDVSNGVYRTKGDANNEADGYTIQLDQILGRQVVVVPYVGKLLAFAKTKVGFGLLVILPAIAVILGEGLTIFRELQPKRARNFKPEVSPMRSSQENPALPEELLFPSAWVNRPLQRPLLMDSISRRLVIFLAALTIMIPATWAHYSDMAQSTNNTFTAATDFGGPSPTPTETVVPSPSPSPTATVVINEVLWMGSGSPSDEWIELRNMTGEDINLAGWTLINAGGDGSTPDDIVLTGTIPANGYWLLGNVVSSSSAISNSITVNQVTTDVELVNGGEQLALKDASNVTIDASPVTSGSWPHGDNSPDQQSMERNLTPSDGTVADNWHTCVDASCNDTLYWDVEGDNYGTPKAANL